MVECIIQPLWCLSHLIIRVFNVTVIWHTIMVSILTEFFMMYFPVVDCIMLSSIHLNRWISHNDYIIGSFKKHLIVQFDSKKLFDQFNIYKLIKSVYLFMSSQYCCLWRIDFCILLPRLIFLFSFFKLWRRKLKFICGRRMKLDFKHVIYRPITWN